MKKYFPVYVRVPLLFALFFVTVEYLVGGTPQKPAFIEHPVVLILLGLFLFALVAVEIVAAATNKVLDRLLTPEERAEKERLANLPVGQSPWMRKIMQKLTRTKGIEQEGEVMLNHDYDGIKELDNDLPPWWVGLFYVTTIFAVIYLLRFHVFEGDNQIVEFNKEMALAKVQVEDYKKTAKDLITADQAQYLSDEASLAAGKDLFSKNCIACHAADGGGGIGPNLTDDHWILGGGIKNIFNTISEGGRDGKGMVAWKATFKASDIEKLASYVISLNGTKPAAPKDAEGDKIWSKAELEGGATAKPVEEAKPDAAASAEPKAEADSAEEAK
ncbi:MAG: c-type cytochrome [Flavobacteriaceae bacterium]|jgi:cytochrome c oxidase cbb3-type subunit 3|nr:c-type cytochrome [Flavobacteriaceae bacterium]